MNLNELAQEITVREGKKIQVNVAQIKEIIHVIGEIFSDMGWFEFFGLANKIRKSGRR